MTRDHSQEPAAAELRRSGAVHDVNQMLTAVIGRAQLALAREGAAAAGPDVADDLRSILLAARDAVGMLQRLRGADETEGSCDVGRALRDAARIILPPDGRWRDEEPAGEGWSLACRAPEGLGAAVPAAVLREVTANLLRNAIEAQPRGGAVTLTAEAADDAVVVRVADVGPGLAQEARTRIFEAGVSASGEVGRGIGLAACRQLLADHGARISAGGEAGAVFEMTLPAAPALAPAPAEPAAPDARRPRLRVLVVDDEPAVRGMLCDVLASLGCTVVAAAGDAAAAQEAFARGGGHLALIDHTLPGVDGPELARRLRSQDGMLVTVLMTGLGNEAVLDDVDPASVDRTLTKPLDLDALRALLGEAQEMHALRAAAGPTSTRDDL